MQRYVTTDRAWRESSEYSHGPKSTGCWAERRIVALDSLLCQHPWSKGKNDDADEWNGMAALRGALALEACQDCRRDRNALFAGSQP